MTIWLNGQLVENGVLDASSAGVGFGWGVFTTIGVRGGSPLHLARHFERLERDARAADIPFSGSWEEVEAAVTAVLRANAVKDGLARLTLTRRGDGRWNSAEGADLSVMAHALVQAPGILRVQLSPYRVEAKRPLVGVKTTSYLPYFWAWKEAKAAGFDEAILRDGRDFLSEGARTSLLWVKGSEIYTPSLETGCLRGLGRDLVLEWAAENQIPVQEGLFSVGVALEADEAFLLSAASGLRSITSWHDEAGELLWEWKTEGSMSEKLKLWWAA